jgi:putative membrane protein
MMVPEHTMWWPFAGMWIFPLIFFAVVILAVFLFAGRWGCGRSWCGMGRHHGEEGKSDSALEILKQRYARGELSRDEFEQMKKDILS